MFKKENGKFKNVRLYINVLVICYFLKVILNFFFEVIYYLRFEFYICKIIFFSVRS